MEQSHRRVVHCVRRGATSTLLLQSAPVPHVGGFFTPLLRAVDKRPRTAKEARQSVSGLLAAISLSLIS
jgi:hypothetical protein